MKSLVITPKKPYSARILEIPKPNPHEHEVLVKILEAGICTTDREIYQGLYGEAPFGENYLIMEHESLGVVESLDNNVENFKGGEYVVRTVRRPCTNSCLNCSFNEQDMCLTGNFSEVGIKGLHGIMTEYYTDSPENLVVLRKEYKDLGVLLEPLSFCIKSIKQSRLVQRRMKWNLNKALIFGAGTIGLLETFILRADGITTDVVSRSKKGNYKSEIIQEIGGGYYSLNDVDKLGKYDLIIECSGHSENIARGLKHLNNNGVLCLTSITGGNRTEKYPINAINLDLVLGNKTILGVVNANYKDYVDGEKLFSLFESKWPGLLKKIITKRVPFIKKLKIDSLFKQNKNDIKVVLDF